jgi:hypothetical protein
MKLSLKSGLMTELTIALSKKSNLVSWRHTMSGRQEFTISFTSCRLAELLSPLTFQDKIMSLGGVLSIIKPKQQPTIASYLEGSTQLDKTNSRIPRTSNQY